MSGKFTILKASAFTFQSLQNYRNLKNFLAPRRRSFTPKIPLLPSFFDFFDLVVNFLFKYSGFKGILALKKVNADALLFASVFHKQQGEFGYRKMSLS
ncbi:MAG: hypothetical protein LBG22_01280 [Treponema sp.]|jgi:hypothetical protein|nr:hypothetical protein [Treponema sp.]